MAARGDVCGFDCGRASDMGGTVVGESVMGKAGSSDIFDNNMISVMIKLDKSRVGGRVSSTEIQRARV
jgi:hypothetical protein